LSDSINSLSIKFESLRCSGAAGNAQMLPALEPQQELKLKQLTVMTLAERSKVDICYGSPIFVSSIMLNQVETPRSQKQTAIKHSFYALVP
jgi:hypothetical protein